MEFRVKNHDPFKGLFHNKTGLLLLLVLFIAGCRSSEPDARTVGIIQFTDRQDDVSTELKKTLQTLMAGSDIRLTFLERNAHGDTARLVESIDEMIRADVDVLVALTTPVALAARDRTAKTRIPLIFSLVSNPVEAGLVKNMARSNGNITGVMTTGNLVNAKQLELFHDMEPSARRILLVHSDIPSLRSGVDNLLSMAKTMNLDVKSVEVQSVAAAERAYESVAPGTVDAIYVPFDPIVTQADRARLRLIRRDRIPAIGGGVSVMTYGPVPSSIGRQTAVMTAKVLRGADPATLPVERPGHYRLTLSARNAATAGYIIRESAYNMADEVLE